MSLWKIAWRSIQQRALASILTAVSMALGVTLVISVLVIHGVVDASFRENAQGYDVIVGGKGGSLQLVLNTVYYLSRPTQNLPYSFYKEFTENGQFAKAVQVAIPVCMGDNYQGFRVVGTTPQLFDTITYQGQKVQFAEGRPFNPEHYFEAVIGSRVARKTGLKVGQQFRPTHGIDVGLAGPSARAVHRGRYPRPPPARPTIGPCSSTSKASSTSKGTSRRPRFRPSWPVSRARQPASARAGVAAGANGHSQTGVAAGANGHSQTGVSPGGHAGKPNAKPAGRHRVTEHHEAGHHAGEHHHDFDPDEPVPDELKEVTAILVRTNMENPVCGMSLPKMINKEQPDAQAVLPTREITELFDGIVGNVQKLLAAVCGLGAGRGRDRHHGQHLQFDERAAARDRRDAGLGRRPDHGDAGDPAGVDPVVAGRRRFGAVAGPRIDRPGESDHRGADGRKRALVAIRPAGVDPDSRTGGAGLVGRISPRPGRLPHRCGQVAEGDAVIDSETYEPDDLEAGYDDAFDEPYRAVSSAAVVSLVFAVASILAFLDWLLLFIPLANTN